VHRVALRMHALLLDTTTANLEVSVEPERGFSFMNGTKTVSRNNFVSKQLNNLFKSSGNAAAAESVSDNMKLAGGSLKITSGISASSLSASEASSARRRHNSNSAFLHCLIHHRQPAQLILSDYCIRTIHNSVIVLSQSS
jgi:hypothetical protein